MPGGCLLVGVGGPEQSLFREWRRSQLQSDGESIGCEPAWDGDGRQGGQ